jgi:hypothetical protein
VTYDDWKLSSAEDAGFYRFGDERDEREEDEMALEFKPDGYVAQTPDQGAYRLFLSTTDGSVSVYKVKASRFLDANAEGGIYFPSREVAELAANIDYEHSKHTADLVAARVANHPGKVSP